MSAYSIWQLTEEDAERAAAVIARAFADEPVHCYALPGLTADERIARLTSWLPWPVRYGCRFGEVWAVGCKPSVIEGVAWWTPMPEAEITDERVAEVITAPLAPALLAVADRMMEAELAVDAVLARVLPGHHRHLHQLAVEPACQGHGLGRALLGKLLADAAAAGVPLCLWTATPGNVAFYQGAGMVLLAEGAAEGDRTAWWAFSTPEQDPTGEETGRG